MWLLRILERRGVHGRSYRKFDDAQHPIASAAEDRRLPRRSPTAGFGPMLRHRMFAVGGVHAYLVHSLSSELPAHLLVTVMHAPPDACAKIVKEVSV